MTRWTLLVLCLVCAGLSTTARGQGVDGTFWLTDAAGPSGSIQSARSMLDISAAADGLSFGICHDSAVLTINDATESPLLAGSAFLQIQVFPDGVTLGVVIDLAGFEHLGPEDGLHLLDIEYLLTGPDGTVTIGNAISDPDLDTGETLILNPGGGSNDPVQEALIEITNVSGSDDATVLVEESDQDLHPGAGGFQF